ncbi:diguanylate cyclase (GGDEF)-like protein [Silvimonas terrae]|uniref:Diguanylate cyclase (GGDEF)-like protein n=1 Tax=Silvimonas terrae TaxID=300266 RepID=A0A840RM67_9NEIS|nr:sensor domain-containing diguanylate cyclase [Silvimonas terrae]MBB5193282.1 diguanylate cyclase (GGDEF)-like protein [Silvimonas terrae]
MLVPATPPDEMVRLATLRSLRILDTAPEERFDRLTRLARRIFRVPVSMVTLVDSERLWIKSCVGGAAGETPRDTSFCGHAILDDAIFLIPDTQDDPRFADNPLVTGPPFIRFYAGYPLKVENGVRVGSLCLMDQHPRLLDDEERTLLHDLGRIAEQELIAQQLATLDELTRLVNRRGFEALAAYTLGVCRRMGKPATLLFFDLNDFKEINDQFGHAEGDQALMEFAGFLRHGLRESDAVGRLGGDEFLVLLNDADEMRAREIIARLQHQLDELNARLQRGYDLHFSVGVTAFDATRHQAFSTMMAEADAAMYAHKQALRKR